nr:BRCA1-A complex subunit RAP80 isoform X1 [Labrus bergylta]XP_020516213.1 BRCA1-A complex subunit RAP80 isoform X1 [Labrus bergylta]XP_020516214.1 BRCA1-A complex subunit RAP80 isoform X1 [Labrus bergylta]XP_020516215.1 BRCA1-A complex subunit RAP80 isoform X1 [Labrus bergylta]XP_020516217.1 BRCA1-A complex subunit RAP80 isoform X1 [Labrus bergylta]
MRGRTGPSSSSSSSSSVGPPPNRMALRKHVLQDVADVPSGSQRSDHNTQEGGAPDDHRDDRDDELSSPLLPRSPRERRRREKDNKAKEMTEDEMMDLALRLSEQEASMTASRMQKEEEAVMKAIEESMGESQTRACAPLAGPEAALRLCSRRKLSYSNRKQEEVSCSPHATELNGEGREAADDSRSLKRKRRAGSPLLEMPDLSQTQKISQDSACSSDPLDLQPDSQQVSLDLQLDSQQVSLDLQPDSQQVSLDLQLDSQQVSLDLQPDSQQVSLDLQPDSQQSCDSTQIDEGRSPVFPSTGCRAEVLVPRLSQNLLQSCRTSGFVLCSQDSSDDPLKSPQAQTRSPTFPQREPAVFSETEQVDDSETQLSPEGSQSPVFGRTTQHQKSQSACRLQVCNSGFKSSSQESLSSSVRSCRPRSPVFPRILDLHETLPPPDRSGVCTSPVFSDEQAEQGPVGSLSRVLDRTGKRTKIQRATAQIREDKKTDPAPGVTCHVTPPSDEELTEVIRDSSETELSSDMKLLWSDDDDADVTPAAVASPSPVFPEERAVDRADGQTASLNHTTGTNGGDCSQQTSTSERDPHLLSCQAAVSRSAGGGTVHYYWGVPFCPRGLNPDSYTQVILAQMEVYEKSLKQAQRCLLRKVEWGEAVLPQVEKSPLPESMSPEPSDPPEPDVPQRRLLRKRRNRLSEDVDDSPAAEEKEQEDKTDGEEEEEEKVTTEEEKKSDGGGGGQGDSDDCEVCPETQLSHEEDDDRTQDLMMDTDAGAQVSSNPPDFTSKSKQIQVLLHSWTNVRESSVVTRSSPSCSKLQHIDVFI